MSSKAGVVLATVKGDVHDIGKNLVDIILRNNGFKIHNIGIDCTPQTIADAAIEKKADFIGLSGLLVSSAEEMKNVVSHFNERGITTPILCGGAALNAGFVKGSLAPLYKGKIFYAKDSFEAVRIMETGEDHPAKSGTLEKSVESSLKIDIDKEYHRPTKPFSGTKRLDKIKFTDIEKYLNKNRLFKIRWADDKDKNELYSRCVDKALLLTFKAMYGYFLKDETAFNFPRRKTSPTISLSDFITENDFSAVFIATAGQDAVEISKNLFGEESYTKYYYWYGFAAEVTEALAEYLNDIIRKELSVPEKQGRRYSPGYSVWPDLSEQKKICAILDSESIGISLTENFQLVPELSVSGIYIYHPEAVYFSIE
jgi:5-methyltetrahydrofolate--homocysteine methyltransferase